MNAVQKCGLTTALFFNVSLASAYCELNQAGSVMLRGMKVQLACVNNSLNDPSYIKPLSLQLSDDENGSSNGYWDNWGIANSDEPIFTQHIVSSYLGVGFWLPEEFKAKEDDMDFDDWLLSHGLLLSFGLGDKHKGETRLRLDYRWHDETHTDLMMQVEFPF